MTSVNPDREAGRPFWALPQVAWTCPLGALRMLILPVAQRAVAIQVSCLHCTEGEVGCLQLAVSGWWAFTLQSTGTAWLSSG